MTKEQTDLKDSQETFILFLIFDLFIAGTLILAGIVIIAFSFNVSESIAIRIFVFIAGLLSWVMGRVMWHDAIVKIKKL